MQKRAVNPSKPMIVTYLDVTGFSIGCLIALSVPSAILILKFDLLLA